MQRHIQGFTLVEVMIAVAIIAILSAIAYPSYTRYVQRAACEDAKGTVTGAASLMERFRAQNNTYLNGDTSTGFYTQSPVSGKQQYSISAEATATTYTITASPTGTQAGPGTLTLDNTGTRGGTMAAAWANCGAVFP